MKRFIKRKSKKGVSTVIAVILMVAITVVLAGVLYLFASNLMKLPNYNSIDVTFYTTTTPVSGSNYIYENVTIRSVSSFVPIHDIGFTITNAYGKPFPLPTPGSGACYGGAYLVITYWGPNGKYIGQYNLASGLCEGPQGTWQYGGCPVGGGACYGTSPDPNAQFLAGGSLLISWENGTTGVPQNNFYGYDLNVIQIAGVTPIIGSIPLQ
ncbi:MAG: archaellin/type IV pilin N-terminal domain-containing protein [Thermoplasmata archaeon]